MQSESLFFFDTLRLRVQRSVLWLLSVILTCMNKFLVGGNVLCDCFIECNKNTCKYIRQYIIISGDAL